MKVGFRVDGSSSIGSGHLMRCTVLAKELKKRGIEIEFICYKLPNNLNFIPQKNHFNTTEFHLENSWTPELDSKWLVENYQKKYFDILIVDHYLLDALWEREAYFIAKKIFVIDDLANRKHECDYILDQNLYENLENRYNNLIPNNTLKFLGPHYALLREEFFTAGKQVKIRDKGLKNILISFGTGDIPSTQTIKTLSAIIDGNLDFNHIDIVAGNSAEHLKFIKELSRKIPNSKLVVNTNNISQLMLKADLCIGGGGSTSWERCFLALPALTIVIADNQNELTKKLNKNGAVINLGKYTEVTNEMIISALKNITKERLENLSRQAYSVVNIETFRGPKFICDKLFPNNMVSLPKHNTYSLLPLSKKYLRTVYNWRNSDRVRLNMLNSNKLLWKEHQSWFKRISQEDPKSYFIFLYNKMAVGCVYFSNFKKSDNSICWGFYSGITPSNQKGISHLMCFLGLAKFFEEKNFDIIHAYVLEGNEKSQRFHITLGFQQEQSFESNQNKNILKYYYKKDCWLENKNIIKNKLKELFPYVFSG